MRAYPEDLRQKIVAALERGTSKSQAARLFGVSLSSVKRYARRRHGGRTPSPRREGLRKTPEARRENASRLLEEDVKERPAATASNKDAVFS
jgi:transposase